jgi:alpha-pyrone synthase
MINNRAYVNAVAGAVPTHDIHQAYIGWAARRIPDERERALFERMAERAGIHHRWSVLPPTDGGGSPVDAVGIEAARAGAAGDRWPP